jgi:hypothetical protein
MADLPPPPAAAERLGKKVSSPKMLFSDLYKVSKGPLSRLRHSQPQPAPVDFTSDYHVDLISKDKVKQKEAVKRYLADKVRNDWEFAWPPVSATTSVSDLSQDSRVLSQPTATTPSPGDFEADDDNRKDSWHSMPKTKQPDTSMDAESSTVPVNFNTRDRQVDVIAPGKDEADDISVYSTVSEDISHYRPRLEWSSEASEDDNVKPVHVSPFRFDSPDAVGTTVLAQAESKKARRRRDARKEAEWNPGLACFLARRDAWTGARTVRIKPKPQTPLSPTSSRRLFWRSHRHSRSTAAAHDGLDGSTPLSPTSSYTLAQHDSRQMAGSPASDYDLKLQLTNESETSTKAAVRIETIVPLPQPILPPDNPMRASINPTLYLSLYDKIIVHNLQPSCPINLSDMVRASVAGWKRDGEWPPRPVEPSQADVVVVKRKKSPLKGHGRRASAVSASGVRRLSLPFLGRGEKDDRDKEKEREKEQEKEQEETQGPGKVKRGLQRVLGLNRESIQAQIGDNDAKAEVLGASEHGAAGFRAQEMHQ